MFDAHLVPRGLSEEDLESLHVFGVTQALVPARARPGPATAEALWRELDDVLEVQLPRLARHGLTAWAAVGVPAAALPARGLRALLEALPRYLAHPRVVAVGALGFARDTEAEREALTEQLLLAERFARPVLVAASARGKEEGVRRLLQVLRRSGLAPGRVLVDGCDGRSVQAVRSLGFCAGLALHPDLLSAERAAGLVAKLGAERLVLSSRAGDGASDLLALPRAAHLMERAGLSRAVVDKVTRANAAALFSPSV